MFDEISFLVQETLKGAENATQVKDDSFLREATTHQQMPDEVPGFLYHLQKKASTFVIRILPCENLKQDFLSVLKYPDLYPSLRLSEAQEAPERALSFYECDRFEVAQSIKSILGNKRFPMFEEHIFNVSDPGDSWWLKTEQDRLTVLFKLSHTEDMEKLTKLGPLGDPTKTMQILENLYGYFKMIFPVGDYVCAHGQWSVSTDNFDDKNFQYLKQLLKNGETSHDFWEYLRKLEFEAVEKNYLSSLQKANYFLMELSCMRNFWKIVETKL